MNPDPSRKAGKKREGRMAEGYLKIKKGRKLLTTADGGAGGARNGEGEKKIPVSITSNR